MDMKPVYELRDRLHAVAMAGTNLLSEDFRLKHAFEAFEPMEAASPVFAKAGQMTEQLLSPDCQKPQLALLDVLSLMDAVICTLAKVDVEGEIKSVDMIRTEQDSERIIVNAPYSQLKGLIEALTTSGSGNYAFVQNMHRSAPEIFKDYRVRYAMVQALGAPYTELAEMVKEWLMEEDDSILPLLKQDFDPKGKKEMLRRLVVIKAIAGEKENAFYLQQLTDAEKDIRLELIRALGDEPSNKELFLDIVNTEKGKNKQMVLNILANMQDERIDAIFEKMTKKKPKEVCEYLLTSTSKGASKIIVRMCMELLPQVLKMETGERTAYEKLIIKQFCRSVEALIGKSGNDVVNCYRMLLDNKEKLDSLAGDEIVYCVVESQFAKGRERKEQHTWEETIGMHLAVSLVIRDDQQIAELAMEQYENQNGAQKNDNFLTAAALAKLYEGDGCTAWYEEQIQAEMEHEDLENRQNAVRTALRYVKWDERKHGYTMYGYIHNDENKHFQRKLEIPNAETIIQWMFKYQWEELLYYWTNRDHKTDCAKMGEWFYNRFFEIQPGPNARNTMLQYVEYLNGFQWTKCKGLGETFAMRGQPFYGIWEDSYTVSYQIYQFFEELPGSKGDAKAEMDVFIKLVEENQIKYIDNADYYRSLRRQIFPE